MHRAVLTPLTGHSRVDARILTTDVRQDFTDNDKYVIRLTVGAVYAQVAPVTIDGSARPMVRVGTGKEWHGVRWAA